MRLRFTERADKDYAQLPPAVRKVFAKQIDLLLANFRHPSLRAKKFHRSEDLWQARVDRRWRFYFKIQDDEYAIVSITPHPK
jgi:mRNA-degrading endonuclease RelE of RelBE toxin-antitoxin system